MSVPTLASAQARPLSRQLHRSCCASSTACAGLRPERCWGAAQGAAFLFSTVPTLRLRALQVAEHQSNTAVTHSTSRAMPHVQRDLVHRAATVAEPDLTPERLHAIVDAGAGEPDGDALYVVSGTAMRSWVHAQRQHQLLRWVTYHDAANLETSVPENQSPQWQADPLAVDYRPSCSCPPQFNTTSTRATNPSRSTATGGAHLTRDP
jgi:hypothetical protein